MSKEILQEIIKDFDPEKFIHYFREKNRSFAPRAEDLFQYDDDNFRNGKKLGEIQFAQGEKMLICAFQASQPLSERSSKKAQYEKGKKILKDNNADSGIFIFHDSNNNFRFSLIYAEYLGVRRRFSYFKRLTFFVSPRLTNKTFLQQIGECDFFSFENIKEAFSVEPVTKQFYGELQYWYFWAMDKIKFPDDYKYSDDPAKDKEIRNATNLIRLITRIIFIRFLTEKGLIPSELFSGEKLGRVVKDFMKGKKASNFYNAILQNLFFGTLNQKMDERSFADERGYPANMKEYGVKNLYRYGDKFLFSKDKVLKLFKDIPFLNGGLFDCLDKENGSGKVIYVDGFSRNSAKQSIIPDFLFFQQEEERADLSNYGLGASRPVRGLIEILNSYNFTIDENTPVDQEIALDPELLGKVFENLLASYNPETATTARKATGSYYTPREIVDYMVEESLFEYLSSKLSSLPAGEASHNIPSPLVGEGKGEGDNDSRLRQLLSYSEEIPEFSAPERKKIISAIDNIKILDPACGSGAFPMGILHKLVFALQKLDPENKYWHELQYQKALKESEEVFKQDDKNERQERLKEINEAFDEGINYPDYARKLYLIENCIYGVDIQPIAIQISKLRFFISLVLDQKVDKSKENLGIRALPNLETKFVAANTLIGLEKPKAQTNLFENREIAALEDRLKALRHRYFSAKTRREKLTCQKEDESLRQKIVKLLVADGWTSDTAKQIVIFDPYDQNAHADFFDPEWMFGIKNPSPLAEEGKSEGGFDIVIGNPPYVEHKKLKSISSELKNIYSTYSGTADLYVYFYENGVKNLKQDGTLIFITSNKFIKTSYGENLRKYFTNHRINEIIDFTEVHVFDALVASCIFSISKSKNSNNKIKIAFANDTMLDFPNLAAFVDINQFFLSQSNLSKKIWQLENETNLLLKNKIESGSVTMKETGTINIYRGVTTGYNLAFIIDDEKRKELINEDKANKTIIKPLLQGRNIKKWVPISNNEFLLFVPWHFPLHNDTSITGSSELAERKLKTEHSSIYKHLNKFKKELLERNKEETGIRYEWYSLQRCAASYYPEFEKEKIVWGLTADKWAFAYDNEGHYLPSNGYILTSSDMPIKYLLALLNSSLMRFYFGFIGIMTAGGAFTLKQETVIGFPIKKVNKSAQRPFIALVDQILAAKKKDPSADTSALEQEIDKMVYALYGLTPEEIEIVEGKLC